MSRLTRHMKAGLLEFLTKSGLTATCGILV